MRTGRYRTRRGLFGVCVLQAEYNTPSLIGGRVDTSVRDVFWEDIKWNKAPLELEEVNRNKASRVLEIIDARIDGMYEIFTKEATNDKR
jgi:hypothetical protein